MGKDEELLKYISSIMVSFGNVLRYLSDLNRERKRTVERVKKIIGRVVGSGMRSVEGGGYIPFGNGKKDGSGGPIEDGVDAIFDAVAAVPVEGNEEFVKSCRELIEHLARVQEGNDESSYSKELLSRWAGLFLENYNRINLIYSKLTVGTMERILTMLGKIDPEYYSGLADLLGSGGDSDEG